MKYNCEQEFDLKEIFRKLTTPIAPQMVKANEFFAQQQFSLDEFQKNIAAMVESSTK